MRTLTHAEFLALRRFPALDGLRIVAALMVVVVHYAGPGWRWMSGWAGVHIFFALTGFLITTLALREESRAGRVSLSGFYLRRVFRIMPVYFVVLGIVVAVLYAREEPASAAVPELLPYYLTFTNDLTGDLGSLHLYGQAWTLGVEQKFYLVWPLLVFGVAAMGWLKRLAVAGTAFVAALALVGVTGGVSVHYAVILGGCVLAIVMHHPRGYALVRPLTGAVGATALVGVFVAAHLALRWTRAEIGLVPAIAVYTLPVVLLLIGLVPGRGPAAWVLSLRPMVWLGERSYSLYLVQQVAAVVLLSTVPALPDEHIVTAVGVTLVGLAMADLLYRWVELPMIGLGKRLTTRRPPPTAEVRVARLTVPTTAVTAPESDDLTTPVDRPVPDLATPR